jgi:hypothetical protein
MLPKWVYEKCPGVSGAHREAAMARQAQLTKPTGALGRLEQLAIELTGLQPTEQPRAARVRIVIFAGDHGIVAQSVSAYPQEVTIAMMSNFASGGAAISVLARELGSTLEVVDAGTLAQPQVTAASMISAWRPRSNRGNWRLPLSAESEPWRERRPVSLISSSSARWASATPRRRRPLRQACSAWVPSRSPVTAPVSTPPAERAKRA